MDSPHQCRICHGENPVSDSEESGEVVWPRVHQRWMGAGFMMLAPLGIGCSSTATSKQAISANNASTAQASSHHIWATCHRYQSLNKVESIATPWKDTETAVKTMVRHPSHPVGERKSPINVQSQARSIELNASGCSWPRASTFNFIRVQCSRCHDDIWIPSAGLSRRQYAL